MRPNIPTDDLGKGQMGIPCAILATFFINLKLYQIKSLQANKLDDKKSSKL